MLKIRLARHGKKNDPHYRVVCIDEPRKTTGKPVEVLGFWHPKSGQKKLDKEKIEAWVAKGAQTTKAVDKLLSA